MNFSTSASEPFCSCIISFTLLDSIISFNGNRHLFLCANFKYYNFKDILTDEVNDNNDLQINYYYLNLVSC